MRMEQSELLNGKLGVRGRTAGKIVAELSLVEIFQEEETRARAHIIEVEVGTGYAQRKSGQRRKVSVKASLGFIDPHHA